MHNQNTRKKEEEKLKDWKRGKKNGEKETRNGLSKNREKRGVMEGERRG